MDARPFSKVEDVQMNHDLYAEKDVPDHLQDKSQRICLMSVIGPEGCGQQHKSLAMRIYGCKTSKQDANKWAKKIPPKTGNFDVLRVSCNNWIVVPARLEGGQDERGVEERVDAVFELYKQEEIANKERLSKQLDKDTRVAAPLKQKPEGMDENAIFDDTEQVSSEPQTIELTVPDNVRDVRQNFCVLSVVAPAFPDDEPREIAIRVYGCREREEDANRWRDQLRESNPYFHVFVLPTNVWAPLPPDIAKISDVMTSDKDVQKLRDSYRAQEIERRKDQAKEMEAMHDTSQKKVKIEEV